jgi:hypothetical protein
MKTRLVTITLILASLVSQSSNADPSKISGPAASIVKNITEAPSFETGVKTEVLGAVLSAANRKADTFSENVLGKRLKFLEIEFGLEKNENDEDKLNIEMQAVYGLKETQDLFLFNQSSLVNYDSRTTLNFGFGARKINTEETFIIGVNAFYDYELASGHKRGSLGLEALSHSLDLKANFYKAFTKTRKYGDVNETALDGSDLKLSYEVPTKYKPKLYVKHSDWKDGASYSTKNTEFGVTLELNKNSRFRLASLDTKNKKQELVTSIIYSVPLGGVQNVSGTSQQAIGAASSTSLREKMYRPVERENRIMKKAVGSVVVSGF